MDITITINTDNAAFEDDPASEVAGILRDLAGLIYRQGVTTGTSYGLLDSNGNTVGSVEVTD